VCGVSSSCPDLSCSGPLQIAARLDRRPLQEADWAEVARRGRAPESVDLVCAQSGQVRGYEGGPVGGAGDDDGSGGAVGQFRGVQGGTGCGQHAGQFVLLSHDVTAPVLTRHFRVLREACADPQCYGCSTTFVKPSIRLSNLS
jgi:hypothetical protein